MLNFFYYLAYMALTTTKRCKVILLVAGYLFMVLHHIYLIKPPKWSLDSLAVKVNVNTLKDADGPVDNTIAVKKVFKTTLNRKAFFQIDKAPHQLYTIKLLHPIWPTAVNNTLQAYATPATELPVQRSFYLRI